MYGQYQEDGKHLYLDDLSYSIYYLIFVLGLYGLDCEFLAGNDKVIFFMGLDHYRAFCQIEYEYRHFVDNIVGSAIPV